MGVGVEYRPRGREDREEKSTRRAELMGDSWLISSNPEHSERAEPCPGHRHITSKVETNILIYCCPVSLSSVESSEELLLVCFGGQWFQGPGYGKWGSDCSVYFYPNVLLLSLAGPLRRGEADPTIPVGGP